MSRVDRFDRVDFDLDEDDEGTVPAGVDAPQGTILAPSRERAPLVQASPRWIWPINPALILSLGDSVMADRPKKHRPHEGLDIHAAAGTRVYAAAGGTVLYVRDGRQSSNAKTRAAGLWVGILTDAEADGLQYLHRYLHLGTVRNLAELHLVQADPIGQIASPHTSGLADRPHLHFEVRLVRKGGGYGPPLDPRRFLPPLNVT